MGTPELQKVGVVLEVLFGVAFFLPTTTGSLFSPSRRQLPPFPRLSVRLRIHHGAAGSAPSVSAVVPS